MKYHHITDNKICWACGTNWGEKKNASRMLMGKPKGQWPLGDNGHLAAKCWWE